MTFGTRFRAEVSQSPVGLFTALLVTALTLGLTVTNAIAGGSPEEEPPVGTFDRAAVATQIPPGDAPTWMAYARGAAADCPGLPPEVLVAIGHVETRLGRETETSSEGAEGPMQFMPGTWTTYGADGNRDGVVDIMNGVDALHGAARMLCANGGAEPGGLRTALWNYNRSDHYVDSVMRHAGLAT